MLTETQLQTALEDDNTSTGGTAFKGERLIDFLEESGFDYETISLSDANELLKESGIKELK